MGALPGATRPVIIMHPNRLAQFALQFPVTRDPDTGVLMMGLVPLIGVTSIPEDKMIMTDADRIALAVGDLHIRKAQHGSVNLINADATAPTLADADGTVHNPDAGPDMLDPAGPSLVNSFQQDLLLMRFVQQAGWTSAPGAVAHLDSVW